MHSAMDESPACLNCGDTLDGRWCARCGQDGERRLASVPGVVRQLSHELFDLDGRIARTLRTLLVSPGRLTAEYAKGRFVDQISPTRLYLAASAAYFFMAPRLGGGVVRFDDGASFQLGPLGWDSEFLMLLLVPIWAASLRPLVVDRVNQFEEVFVFSVHYNVFFLLFMVLLAAGATVSARMGVPDVAMWVLFVGVFGPVLYLGRALRVAFGLEGARRALTAIGLFVFHLGCGQVVYNVIESGRLLR